MDTVKIGNLLGTSIDKVSARKVFNFYAEFPYSSSFEPILKEALLILHGAHFAIQRDVAKRMFFKCTLCNKEMNNLRSLSEHAGSGIHIKNVESNRLQDEEICVIPQIMKISGTPKQNSLQKMLSDIEVPILGLQKVEAFVDGRNQYYKCNFCGAHARCEAMFKHLIGEKHTDKYINARLVLKNSVITVEERAYLRSVIYKNEKFDMSSIKTYFGRDFYPYLWENDGKQLFSRHNEPTEPSRPSTSLSADVVEKIHSGDIIVSTQTASTQTSIILFNQLMKKFYFMICSYKNVETALLTPEDIRLALIVSSFALHWLYYVQKRFISERGNHRSRHHDKQVKIVKECMYKVIVEMRAKFNKKYPELAVP